MDEADIDPFNLHRFVAAQCGNWETARSELSAGRKTSHWMWYVFPQLKGLGRSARSEFYGIAGLIEAQFYLRHPILGPRLREAVRLVIDAPGSAEAILGGVDAAKLRSCLTLFAHAAPDEPLWREGLARFFDGAECPRTVAMLGDD